MLPGYEKFKRKGDIMADKKISKQKCSYYLKPETTEMLLKVYVERLLSGEPVTKSKLIDEAVELLYKTELKSKE